jgi:hypothetical protein
MADPYHIDVIRGSLTRNIGTLFSELHEEIELQFASEIPLTKGPFSSDEVSNYFDIIRPLSYRVGFEACIADSEGDCFRHQQPTFRRPTTLYVAM